MDPYRGFHRRLLSKRQALSVLGGLVPNDSTPSSAKQSTTTSAISQNSLSTNGIVGEVTTLVGNIPTLIAPSSGPSSATSSTALTLSSSSSAGSTTAPTSSVQTATSTLPTHSTSTSTTSTTPTPTPTATPPASEVVYTSSDGTSVVYVTSTLPAASTTAAPPTSFLQNPSLEGGVFTLVGIVALIIVFVVVTWTLRKRRRDRLERDLAAAVTFDPGATDRYERGENSIDKHRVSGSSLSHDYSHGHDMQLAYIPQQEYHGPVGYGGYPTAVYHASPSNSIPYQAPSPPAPEPAVQRGANLTRKFSDRKPVPPLLPNPAYDPSNTHVSIPPQFYQQ